MFWNKSEVCGYLDSQGDFHRTKIERNERNKEIERAILLRGINNRIYNLLGGFRSEMSSKEMNLKEKDMMKYLEDLVNFQPDIVKFFLQYKEDLEKLDKS